MSENAGNRLFQRQQLWYRRRAPSTPESNSINVVNLNYIRNGHGRFFPSYVLTSDPIGRHLRLHPISSFLSPCKQQNKHFPDCPMHMGGWTRWPCCGEPCVFEEPARPFVSTQTRSIPRKSGFVAEWILLNVLLIRIRYCCCNCATTGLCGV